MRSILTLSISFSLAAFYAHAGPGEIGRPATIPTFEETKIPFPEEVNGLFLYKLDGERFSLSNACWERPVLLVTSSLTCPISRDNCPSVDGIYREFKDRINVLVIYTTEAHPTGSASPYSDREWLTDRNLHDKVLFDQPATLAARIERAKLYKKRMNIQAPIVVDGVDNTVWKTLGGGPNSGVFLDERGRVEERQGWLRPHAMKVVIQEYFNEAQDRELKSRLTTAGYNAWDWKELMLSDKLDEISKALSKTPEFVNLRFSYDRGNYERNTLLHLAVEKDLTENMLLFLAADGGVDRTNYDGETPLCVAAASGGKAIDVLLERGADVNAYSKHGLTPLHSALLNRQTAAAKKLVENGARIDLAAAAGLGDKKTLERFLELYKVDFLKLTRSCGSALSFAAVNGHVEILQRLIESGAPVDFKIRSRPPVYYAIQADQSASIDLLITEGADVSFRVSYSQKPIHFAAFHNKVNAVASLLKHNIDPDQLNFAEETALHWAVIAGNLDVVKLLLKHGANIELRAGSPLFPPCGPPDFDGRPLLQTPLHYAAKHGEADVVKYLISKGAKLNPKDREKQTPLDLAKSGKHSEVISILESAGALVGPNPTRKRDTGATSIVVDSDITVPVTKSPRE